MSGRRGIGARTARVAIRAAVLLVLWLALVDKTERWEVLAGLVCAIIAATIVEAVQATAQLRFAARPRPVLRGLVRAPWWIVRDSALVLAAVVTRRPPAGRLRAVPFPAGGHAPQDRGRRAAALTLGAIGPNQYPMTESAEDDVLLVHELVPRPEVVPADLVREP
jgi:hypothetical protein